MSQLRFSFLLKINPIEQKFPDAPTTILGILGTIVLQLIFSRWSLINTIFSATPLSLTKGLICLIVSIPMIFIVALVKRVDPIN